jgi:choline dehydrogenase-like flavoprotein
MKDYSEYICVIGAGTIGNHIVIELLDRGHQVLAIEAGGVDFETELLGYKDYVFETPSMLPKNVHRVGGGGNYWIGRIGEFLTQDFLPLPGIRDESWPFEKLELDPYYRSVYKKLGHEALLDNEFISKHFADFNQTPAGLGLRPIRYTEPQLLKKSFLTAVKHNNLDFLEATLVTSIRRASEVERPIISTVNADGGERSFEVRSIIVACGALQSAKLFLDSKGIHNSSNHSSAGSYLMEHLDGYVGEIEVTRRNRTFIRDVSLNSDRKIRWGSNLDCGFSLILGSMEKEELDQINVGFEIVNKVVKYRFAPEVNGLTTSSRGLHSKFFFFGERIIRKIFGGVTEIIRTRFLGRNTYSIWLKAEELPHRNSTICIDPESGKLIYKHEISPETSFAVRKALHKFETLMTTENLGKVKFYDDVLDSSKNLTLRPNWHPMGTLRMGEPGESVVDLNLKIHGEEDIYILSSAVFPTGSNQNPVFTTLALGTRLADHLSRKA